MSEPICRALLCSGAGCLNFVGTYLLWSVGQGCRLFMQCLNLLPGHCWAGVQALYARFESTRRAMWGRGAGLFKRCWNLPPGHFGVGCLSSVVTYILGTVRQGCSCLSGVRTYLLGSVGQGSGYLSDVGTYIQGTVGQGCRLFNWCRNLADGHCGAGV